MLRVLTPLGLPEEAFDFMQKCLAQIFEVQTTEIHQFEISLTDSILTFAHLSAAICDRTENTPSVEATERLLETSATYATAVCEYVSHADTNDLDMELRKVSSGRTALSSSCNVCTAFDRKRVRGV